MTASDLITQLFDIKRLNKELRAAHMQVPAGLYLRFDIVVTLLLAFLFILGCLLMEIFEARINLFPFFPYSVSLVMEFVILVILVGAGILYYPLLTSMGRKSAIDRDLPYAITYMEALSSTVTLYQLFRSVYEAEELYGEVSKECGLIVRDVEVFGEDLLTAMRNLQESTPSENLKELLNDLALVFRTGGDLPSFFDSRSSRFRELAKQEMESCLKTMEIIAEVYVTAFVAGPIAMIIMLVAQNMSGHSQLQSLMPMMYIGLPLGAMIMIFILYVILPPDNLSISHSEVRDSEFGGEVPFRTGPEEDKEFLKKVESKKHWLKLTDILRHPFRYYVSDYQYSVLAGGIIACILALLFMNGYLGSVFPSFTYEIFLCLLIIGLMFPVVVAYEARKWYANQIEAQLPEFLREIADMKDVGMTLQGAIHMVAGSKLGVLSSELRIVSDELKLGTSTSNALVRMVERISLVSVKRAISLVVRASEVTEHIRDILTIAISDLNHYLKMKNERLNVSYIYLAVIYLSFGIYLYSAYELNVSFISSFDKFDLDFDISGNVGDMFHIAIILGGFSGIMAGQLSSNNILSGFKHSIIFLVASVVMFVYII